MFVTQQNSVPREGDLRQGVHAQECLICRWMHALSPCAMCHSAQELGVLRAESSRIGRELDAARAEKQALVFALAMQAASDERRQAQECLPV